MKPINKEIFPTCRPGTKKQITKKKYKIVSGKKRREEVYDACIGM